MIQLVVFDIDGVLTDGKVYVDYLGNESKAFRLTEIDALNEIKALGFKIAAITGESTPIVSVFEKKVNWDRFYKGCKNKVEAIKEMENFWVLKPDNICYIGDGKYDIAPIQYVGTGICPDNAIPAVKAVADISLSSKGGEGCVDELLNYLKQSAGGGNENG